MWNKSDKEGFDYWTPKSVGQICRGSLLGEIIYNLCLQDDVNTIFEIGTWNGHGSTKCIADAIKTQTHKSLISLECNLEKVNYAKELYKDYSNINISHSTILKNIPKVEEFYSLFPDIQKDDFKSNGWLNIDIENLKNCDYIEPPKNVDLAILDGGEYTTYYEFQTLKDNSNVNYIILDDVNTEKCNLIRKLLLNNPSYILVKENLQDRHGWSLFKRKSTRFTGIAYT